VLTVSGQNYLFGGLMKLWFKGSLGAFAASLLFSASAYGACVQEGVNFQTADGGCKDLQTGRVWSIDATKIHGVTYTRQLAMSYCADLVEEGYSDWRLPTLAEYQAAAANGAGDYLELAYPDTAGSWRWTSTLASNRKKGYLAKISDGSSWLVSLGSTTYLFCVR